MNNISLGLINYEGDCLKAIKDGDKVKIKDQHGKTLKIITLEELFDFFDGLIDITDSEGKVWNYPSESKESKVKYVKLYNFIRRF
jgi:hypothetical protein